MARSAAAGDAAFGAAMRLPAQNSHAVGIGERIWAAGDLVHVSAGPLSLLLAGEAKPVHRGVDPSCFQIGRERGRVISKDACVVLRLFSPQLRQGLDESRMLHQVAVVSRTTIVTQRNHVLVERHEVNEDNPETGRESTTDELLIASTEVSGIELSLPGARFDLGLKLVNEMTAIGQ